MGSSPGLYLSQLVNPVADAFRNVFGLFRTATCRTTSSVVLVCRNRLEQRPPARRLRSPPVMPCHLGFRITHNYNIY